MPSKIEYVDETWNPVTGCTKVSPGCENCYAERMARRLAGRFGYPEAPRHFDVTLHPNRLDEPLRRKKPTRYLVCSMGDLFHADVPFSFITRVWMTAAQTPQHTYLVLTKRPRMARWFVDTLHKETAATQPMRNVWLGVTVENQDEVWRVDELLKVPAALHWVSLEPMLGPIEIPNHYLDPGEVDSGGFTPWDAPIAIEGPGPVLDLVVLGGETGPGARPCRPDWVRKVRDDCVAAGVDFFFKNWGGWHPAVWLTEDGDIAAIKAEYDNSEDVFGDEEYMLPVPRGQKSGRVLDGLTWDEMPETDV